MRINDGSICSLYKHFNHECGVGEDYDCAEYCSHDNDNISDKFWDYDVVEECEGFDKS